MKNKTSIVICLGSSCYRRGNQTVLEVVKNYLSDNHLNDQVEFRGHLCTGNCLDGPNIKINDTKYSGVDSVSIIEILNSHFK